MTIFAGRGFVEARAAGAFVPGFGHGDEPVPSFKRSDTVLSVAESVATNRNTVPSPLDVDK